MEDSRTGREAWTWQRRCISSFHTGHDAGTPGIASMRFLSHEGASWTYFEVESGARMIDDQMGLSLLHSSELRQDFPADPKKRVLDKSLRHSEYKHLDQYRRIFVS